MPPYKGVFEGSGGEAVEPMAGYRSALDAARSMAWRSNTTVRIIDVDGERVEMIVHPDGSTERPRG